MIVYHDPKIMIHLLLCKAVKQERRGEGKGEDGEKIINLTGKSSQTWAKILREYLNKDKNQGYTVPLDFQSSSDMTNFNHWHPTPTSDT